MSSADMQDPVYCTDSFVCTILIRNKRILTVLFKIMCVCWPSCNLLAKLHGSPLFVVRIYIVIGTRLHNMIYRQWTNLNRSEMILYVRQYKREYYIVYVICILQSNLILYFIFSISRTVIFICVVRIKQW